MQSFGANRFKRWTDGARTLRLSVTGGSLAAASALLLSDTFYVQCVMSSTGPNVFVLSWFWLEYIAFIY